VKLLPTSSKGAGRMHSSGGKSEKMEAHLKIWAQRTLPACVHVDGERGHA
jgi:hypothetical protein